MRSRTTIIFLFVVMTVLVIASVKAYSGLAQYAERSRQASQTIADMLGN